LPKDLDGNSATPKSFVEIKEWDVLSWTESWYEIKYSKLKFRIEMSPLVKKIRLKDFRVESQ